MQALAETIRRPQSIEAQQQGALVLEQLQQGPAQWCDLRWLGFAAHAAPLQQHRPPRGGGHRQDLQVLRLAGEARADALDQRRALAARPVVDAIEHQQQRFPGAQ